MKNSSKCIRCIYVRVIKKDWILTVLWKFSCTSSSRGKWNINVIQLNPSLWSSLFRHFLNPISYTVINFLIGLARLVLFYSHEIHFYTLWPNLVRSGQIWPNWRYSSRGLGWFIVLNNFINSTAAGNHPAPTTPPLIPVFLKLKKARVR